MIIVTPQLVTRLRSPLFNFVLGLLFGFAGGAALAVHVLTDQIQKHAVEVGEAFDRLTEVQHFQTETQRYVVTVPVQTYDIRCGIKNGIPSTSREQVPFPVYAPDKIWAVQVALRATAWTETEWKKCEQENICPHVSWPASQAVAQ